MFPLNSRKKQLQGFYMFYPSKKYFNGKGHRVKNFDAPLCNYFLNAPFSSTSVLLEL